MLNVLCIMFARLTANAATSIALVTSANQVHNTQIQLNVQVTIQIGSVLAISVVFSEIRL